MPASLWRIACAVPDAARAEAAARALELGGAASVSAFETAPGGPWLVESLSAAIPDAAALEVRLALALGGDAPSLTIERLAAKDWLAENQQAFPPLTVGRYRIHGTHLPEGARTGRIAVAIDAATAFGTGEHGSTRGCLLAIHDMAKRGRPTRILDMGTGTGILAIAAAKTWRRRVAAFDIDPEAVRVAARNARVNGVAGLMASRWAASPADRVLDAGAPYDLVLANILARPLIAMARGLARAAAPNARVVLAGLLPWQEAAVLAAWRRVGFNLRRRILVDGWSTLILARAATSAGR
jgi:ribosomal protein L11 methyltransferase